MNNENKLEESYLGYGLRAAAVITSGITTLLGAAGTTSAVMYTGKYLADQMTSSNASDNIKGITMMASVGSFLYFLQKAGPIIKDFTQRKTINLIRKLEGKNKNLKLSEIVSENLGKKKYSILKAVKKELGYTSVETKEGHIVPIYNKGVAFVKDNKIIAHAQLDMKPNDERMINYNDPHAITYKDEIHIMYFSGASNCGPGRIGKSLRLIGKSLRLLVVNKGFGTIMKKRLDFMTYDMESPTIKIEQKDEKYQLVIKEYGCIGSSITNCSAWYDVRALDPETKSLKYIREEKIR